MGRPSGRRTSLSRLRARPRRWAPASRSCWPTGSRAGRWHLPPGRRTPCRGRRTSGRRAKVGHSHSHWPQPGRRRVGQERVLADRYALVSPLGRGGMGQVWEGRDTPLDRRVAVKVLTAGAFTASPDFAPDARRFTREAAVTAGLAHPSVPAIFDAGTYDDGLYLVMELVDGCTIGDLLAEQGPLPPPWAAVIAGQVAAVLAIAHQRGILHRDIKPPNVMLTRDGTAKLLDFGVAGIVSQRITSTGVTVGTPGYIAPEQLHGLPATAQ